MKFERSPNGGVVQITVEKTDTKVFSSGKSGFYGRAVVKLAGKEYTAQIQLIERGGSTAVVEL